MTRPANRPAQPEPVSRLVRTATSATATVIAATDGIRSTAGLLPTATQKCMSR